MTDNVCDRILKLEISETQIFNELADQDKKLTEIAEKQAEIFKMILAIKWLSMGMAGLLLIQNVGVLEVIKKVLL